MTTPAQDALLARMLEEVAHLPSANTFRLGVARRVRLYRFLSDLADRGAPLPGNDVLRQAAGFMRDGKASGAFSRCLKALERHRLITVLYEGNRVRRRVRIHATGRATDWQAPQEWWGWAKGRAPAPKKPAPPTRLRDRPMIFQPPVLPCGRSDIAIYGHLAEAVRACRRAGDVVYRDPDHPTDILINGRPGDPATRAAWHLRQREGRRAAA